MSYAQQTRRYTPDEYYRLEVQADHRSEFFDGKIFAMAGGSLRHNRICVNITRHLGNKLEGTPCSPFGLDLKLRIKPTGIAHLPGCLSLLRQAHSIRMIRRGRPM